MPPPPTTDTRTFDGRTPTTPVGSPTLRITYVGPNMELFQAAYRSDHHRFHHESRYVRTVADLRLMRPMPDVVLISPLVITPAGIRGACAAQAILPPSTLLVVLYNSLGSSHAMYCRHALAGNCHPRILLHYPTPALTATDVVARIDTVARGRGGGPQVATTGHLPGELTLGRETTDLGRLLSDDTDSHRNNASLTFARLLHAAAVDPTWATWKDLANRLGFAEGHVKNTKAKLGRHIRNEVMVRHSATDPSTHVGVPRDQRAAWRIAEFTRFVTEHRSFIRAYCEHHLDLDHPTHGGA